MDVNVKLEKDGGDSKPVDRVVNQSMVESLIYAASATRPDIAQAVGTLPKFNLSPNEAHLTAVKRVFRYLKGTVKLVSGTKPVIKIWKDIPTQTLLQIQTIEDLLLATYFQCLMVPLTWLARIKNNLP